MRGVNQVYGKNQEMYETATTFHSKGNNGVIRIEEEAVGKSIYLESFRYFAGILNSIWWIEVSKHLQFH